MAQHSHYWSCSRFADWLRGTPKLSAGTSDEWRDWHDQARGYNPIRYWLAEEALDHIQDFVTWPVRKIYDVKYYINNRFVTRTHALTAHARDIKPGQWQDVGNRFLPCLFNELVDFVEVELAWWHIAWDDEAKKKYQAPFWARGWFRWRTWRCAQAGLDNLAWQMSIRADESYGLQEGDKGWNEPTRQAINAREIFDLYTWWTTTYRNRPEPMEASGWSAHCDRLREATGGSIFSERGVSKELRREGEKALKLCHKIEEQYRREDEQMMIRLIKIRDSLWT